MANTIGGAFPPQGTVRVAVAEEQESVRRDGQERAARLRQERQEEAVPRPRWPASQGLPPAPLSSRVDPDSGVYRLDRLGRDAGQVGERHGKATSEEAANLASLELRQQLRNSGNPVTGPAERDILGLFRKQGS